MQLLNWNDLRVLLAVQAGGTLSRAGHILGVDGTTVSRRMKALQGVVGKPLYRRNAEGTIRLTAAGVEIAAQAEYMQMHANMIERVMNASQTAVVGSVRITSVPMLINRLLAPGVAALLNAHPNLSVELIPDSRNFSLTRREADIALRLARPRQGGRCVIARRLGDIDYAVYAARDLPAGKVARLPWIGYEDAMQHLPQAQWLQRVAGRGGGAVSGLKVHDAETALEAAIAGIGRTALPRLIADPNDRLQVIAAPRDQPLPSRELWLLVHRDLKDLLRIREVIEWIDRLVRGAAA